MPPVSGLDLRPDVHGVDRSRLPGHSVRWSAGVFLHAHHSGSATTRMYRLRWNSNTSLAARRLIAGLPVDITTIALPMTGRGATVLA